MISAFSYAFNAIAPILLLAVMGYTLKKRHLVSEEFFRKMNSFVFHYSFPFLMFENLYNVDGIKDLDFRLAAFLVGSIGLLTILGIIIANYITDRNNRKGVIIQAGFRSNFALIGLPLAEGLAGQEGLLVTSSLQAPIVIYYNFFSVLFLAIYSEDAAFSVRKVIKNILRNPLIQGLSAGIAALLIREVIPVSADGQLVFSIKNNLPWVYKTISYLARVATPIALVSLGGQFEFSHASGMKKELVTSVFMRLILAPAIGFSLAAIAVRAGFISFTPASVSAMVACFGSPLAVSAVPMAAEMGADSDLAGQIVLWTSLLSMFTIFAITVLFRTIGIL